MVEQHEQCVKKLDMIFHERRPFVSSHRFIIIGNVSFNEYLDDFVDDNPYFDDYCKVVRDVKQCCKIFK